MAVFVITTGERDAMETAGTVVVTGAAANNDHDATTDWSGVSFEPGVGGNPAGPGQGATITACSLALTVSNSTADRPNVTIWGEKVVNSAVFTTTASNISGRTLTTASVNWASTDLGAGTNTVHSTSDLTTVVQELVNQASWTTTSPLTFLIQGSSDATRDLQYRHYEYTGTGGTDPQGTYSAVLTLTWTGGGGTTTDTGDRHLPRGVMRGVLRGVV